MEENEHSSHPEEREQSKFNWDEENIKSDQAEGQHMIQEMDQSKGRSQSDTDEHHSRDFSQVHQRDLSKEEDHESQTQH